MTQQEREKILDEMNNAKNLQKKSDAKPSDTEKKLAEINNPETVKKENA